MNFAVAGRSNDQQIVSNTNLQNSFVLYITKNGLVRWAKQFDTSYNAISFVKLSQDGYKVIASPDQNSKYIAVLSAIDGSMLYSYKDPNNNAVYFLDSIYVDASENIYLTSKNPNGIWEVSKFKIQAPPVTPTWLIIGGASGTTNLGARVIVKGADETEYFVGGLVRDTNTDYLTGVTRLTDTGSVSWHYGYIQTGSPYYYFIKLQYASFSGTNYVFGVAENSNGSPSPLLFTRYTLSSTATNVPTAVISYKYLPTNEDLVCPGIRVSSATTMYALLSYKTTAFQYISAKIDFSTNSMQTITLSQLTGTSTNTFEFTYGMYFSDNIIYYVGRTFTVNRPTPLTYSQSVAFLMTTDSTQSCVTFTYPSSWTTVASGFSLSGLSFGQGSVTMSTRSISLTNPSPLWTNAASLTSQAQACIATTSTVTLTAATIPTLYRDISETVNTVYVHPSYTPSTTCTDSFIMYSISSPTTLPSYITYNPATQTFTVTANSAGQVGTTAITLVGYLPNNLQATVTFNIIVTNCASATITPSSLADQQYAITQTLQQWAFPAFTISITPCAVYYSLTKQDGTAFDSSVFTFDATNLKVSAYSTDNTKVAIYPLKVSVVIGGSTNTNFFNFQVTVLHECTLSVITPTTITNKAYTTTSATLTIANFDWTINKLALCGPLTYTLLDSGTSLTPDAIFNQLTSTATVYTTNTAKAATYNLKVRATTSTPAWKSLEVLFTVTVSNDCSLTTVTAQTIAAQTYTIGNSALAIPIPAFTDSLGVCSPIIYTYSCSDTSFISQPIAGTLQISTSTVSKANTYTVTVTGTTTLGSKFASTTFSLTLVDPCLSATLSTTAVTSPQTYQINTGTTTIPITAFTSTVSAALCGAMSYTATYSSNAALDNTVFTFNSGTIILSVNTALVAKVNSYTIKINGQQGTYSSRATFLTFVVNVVDSCPTQTYTVPTIAAQSYTVNQAAHLITISDFTSPMANSVCGVFTYSAVNAADNSAIDSALFTFVSTPGSLSLNVYSALPSKVGTYSIKIRGYQGTYSTNIQSTTISITVVDPCPTAVISSTPIATQTYQVNTATLTITVTGFTSSVSVCGSMTYSATYSDGTPYDATIFTATATGMNVYTNSPAKIGTYVIKVSGYSGTYSSNKGALLITINIVDGCTTATYTKPTISAQNYQVNTASQSVSIVQFTSSMLNSICGDFTYTATNNDGSAIDSSIFTFTGGVITTASTLTFVTTNPALAGIYLIKVSGHQGTYASNAQFITITVNIVDGCTSAAYTMPSIIAQTYQINTVSLSVSIAQFTSAMTNTICGTFTYTATNNNGSPIDSTVFTFTPGTGASASTLDIYTQLTGKVGSYVIQVSGYQGSYSPNKQSFTISISIIDGCPSATFTKPTIASQSYQINTAAINVPIAQFTSSMLDSICGTFTYNLLNNDGSALDTSLYTFTLGALANPHTLSIYTTLISKVNNYVLKLEAYQGTYTVNKQFININVAVNDGCLTATITFPTIAAQTYQINTATISVSINQYTSSMLDSVCGTFTYTALNSDNSALDSSVFTFTQGSPHNLAISTSLTAKVGTYSIKVTGYQGSYSSNAKIVTISVSIIDNCPTSVFTMPTIAAQTYQINTATITVPISQFTPSMLNSVCGSFTYSLTNSDNTAYDSQVYIFAQGAGVSPHSLSIYTINIAKVATYTLKLSGYQGSYTANTQSITISVSVIDGCPTATITKPTIAAQTYQINTSAITLSLAQYTSTMSDTICGTFSYTLTNSDSSAIDNSIFIFTLGTLGAAHTLQIYSISTSAVGPYNLILSGQQGIYSSNAKTVSISITIIDDCPAATFTMPSISALSYQINAPLQTISVAQFSSSVSNSICGTFTYIVKNSDNSNIDTSVFTYTQGTGVSPHTISVYTISTFKVQIYTVKVSAYQGSYTANTQFITITINVIDDCPTATLGSTSIAAQTYQVNTALVNLPISAFTSSMSDSICGVFSYTATYNDGTSLDNTVFTFTNLPSPLNLAVYTTDTDKRNLYSIRVRGYQGSYSSHYTDLVISINVIDQCRTATISTTAIATQEYQIIDITKAIAISPFTSTMSDTICGTFSYTATYSDGSALDTFIQFTTTPFQISVYTTDVTKIGSYTIKITGQQGAYSVNSKDLTFFLHVVQLCPVSTITTTPIVATQIYQVNTAILNIPISDFLSGMPDFICGPFTYHATNDVDGSAIDLTVFTFDDTPGNMKFSVYTIDPSKEALYKIRINGHQGSHASNTQYIVITIQIKDDCKIATITLPAVTSQIYQINTNAILLNYAFFTSTMSGTICGAFIYSITYSDGSAIDTSVFTFNSAGSMTLNTYTTLTSKVNNYALQITGQQGAYTVNKQSISIPINVIDNCPATTIGVPTILAQTYQIYVSTLTVNIPLFTSTMIDAICGTFSYTATYNDNSAIDTSVFTFTQNVGLNSLAVFSNLPAKVGSYSIKITGYQGSYSTHSNSIVISVNVVDNCPTAIISVTAALAQTYDIWSTLQTLTITAFTSSIPECGSFIYAATKSDNTAFDSSLFNFPSTSAPQIKIYSTDSSKAGTYQIKVKGYQGIYTSNANTITVAYTVTDRCRNAVIGVPSITTQNYNTHYPALNIPITAFTSDQPDSQCGAFSYSISYQDGTPIDNLVFTFTTPSGSNPQLAVSSSDQSKTGTFHIKITGMQGSYTINAHTVQFDVVIVDLCPISTLTTVPVSSLTYNLYYPSSLINITPFTSSEPNAYCGSFIYTATYSDLSSLDTTVFTFTATSPPSVSVFSNLISKVGVYNIIVKGYQSNYAGHSTSVTFTMTIVDLCPITTLGTTAVSAQSYNLYYPVLNVPIQYFTSTQANSICGAFQYSATYTNTNPLDISVFTFTDTGTQLQLAVSSSNTAKIGVYSITIQGHQGIYTGHSTSITFTVTIIDQCPTATLVVPSVLTQTYNIQFPTLTILMAAFTSSEIDAYCGSFVYQIDYSNGTPIDLSVFTFQVTGSGQPKLDVFTNDISKDGVYNIRITGYQSNYPTHFSTVTFTVNVVDLCPLATLSNTVVAAVTYNVYYPQVNIPIPQFTSNQPSSLCGDFKFFATKPDGTTFDTSIFQFPSISIPQILVQTNNPAASPITYQIKVTGYQGVYTTHSTSITVNIIIVDLCPGAIISATAVINQNYFIRQTIMNIDIPAFASTEPLAYCGNFIYLVTKTDDSALDATIFTFNSGTLKLDVYTILPSQAGTYSIKVKAYNGIYTANFYSYQFNVIITDPCTVATVTTPTLATQTYSIYKPLDTVTITQFVSSVSNLYCGDFINTITNSDGTPADSSVMTLDLTTALTNIKLKLYSNNPAKVGTYHLKINGYQQYYPGNSQNILFDLIVDDPCGNTVIITPTYISPQQYFIGDPKQQLPITFSENVGFCGTFTYTISNPDSQIISVNTLLPKIEAYSIDFLKINTYTLNILATLSNGGRSVTATLVLNVLNPCLYTTIGLQSVLTSFNYNIDQDGLKYLYFPLITVNPQRSICGDLIISVTNSDLSAIDKEIFYFYPKNPPFLRIKADDQKYITIYPLTLKAYYPKGAANVLVQNFNVNVQQIIDPCKSVKLYSLPPQNSYKYTLGDPELIIKVPNFYDNLGTCGNASLLIINQNNGLIKYIEKKNEFSIKTSNTQDVKSYLIQVIGTVQAGASLTVDITIEVVLPSDQKIYQRPVEPNKTVAVDEETWKLQVSKQKLFQAFLSASITEITNQGVMKIKFSSEIINIKNQSTIDKSVLQLSILPGSSSNLTKLGFNWTLIEFDTHMILIQLIFENPPDISSHYDPDQIQVVFLKEQLFRDAKTYDSLPMSYTLEYKLPQLLKQDPMTIKIMGIGQYLAQSIEGSSGGYLFLSFIVSTSLSFLWCLIYSIQLIMCLPQLNITFPANVKKFFELLSNVSISPTEMLKSQISLLAQQTIYGEAFKLNGEKFQDAMLNISVFVLYFTGLIVIALILYVLKHLTLNYPRVHNVLQQVDKIIFFNFVLRLCLIGYLDFAISTLKNVQIMEFSDRGERLTSFVTILCIFLTFGFPIAIAVVNFVRSNKEQKTDFIQRFNSLKAYLKPEKMSLSCTSIFVVRRLLFGFVIAFLSNSPFLQAQLTIAQSTLVLMYLAKYSPFDDWRLNWLELYNEGTFMTIAYLTFCFTDYGPDAGNRYDLGYIAIGITCLNLLINLGHLLTVMIQQLINKIKDIMKYIEKRRKTKIYSKYKFPNKDSSLSVIEDTQMMHDPTQRNLENFVKLPQHAQLATQKLLRLNQLDYPKQMFNLSLDEHNHLMMQELDNAYAQQQNAVMQQIEGTKPNNIQDQSPYQEREDNNFTQYSNNHNTSTNQEDRITMQHNIPAQYKFLNYDSPAQKQSK